MTPVIAVGLALSAVGALLLVVARRKQSASRAFISGATRAEGRIVELTGEDDDFPTVEFEDERGRAHRVEGQTNTSGAIGDVSIVFYRTDDPSTARLASDMSNTGCMLYIVGFVLGATGVVTAAMGAWG